MKLNAYEEKIRDALESHNYDYVLEEAAVQSNCGSVYATYILGLCAQYGYGQPINIASAIVHYEHASSCGDADASFEFGKMLIEGDLVEQNVNKGLSLLEVAAKQDNIEALNLLGRYYEALNNIDKAIEYYQKAVRISDSIMLERRNEEIENDGNPSIISAEYVTLSLTNEIEVSDRGYITGYNEGNYNYNIQIPPVVGIWSFAFSKKEYLKRIVITACESIGHCAFWKCANLEKVTFSNPYNTRAIGGSAFFGTSLKNILMPHSVKNMGSWCFGDCTDLSYVEFSNGMDGIRAFTFHGCYNLEQVSLPDMFAESNYHAIADGAFGGCNKLHHIVFPQNLEIIGKKAFENCAGLKQAIFPTSLQEIGESAFYNCASLEKVVIPGSVNVIETDAFAMCNKLKSITIPMKFKSKMKRIFGDTLFSKGKQIDGVNVLYI